ncbi:hypothetical protein [Adhaeretor mobilis]|uniref:hypothetical protein n=1 Tax=Adhaeretor mobilis TaxID=1930276 RepID=UPI001FE8816A|nr:hypothetical protein [Adhaeretor mobilis]
MFFNRPLRLSPDGVHRGVNHTVPAQCGLSLELVGDPRRAGFVRGASTGGLATPLVVIPSRIPRPLGLASTSLKYARHR